MARTAAGPISDLDDASVTAWGLVLEGTNRVSGALGRQLEDEVGIPLTWFEVLLRLARSPDRRLRMVELSRQISFSDSGLSRLADRMEKAGLIDRALCRTDRRGTEAVLTGEGAEVLERALAVHLRGLRTHVLDHLTAQELDVLTRVMDRLRTAAEGPGSRSGRDDAGPDPAGPGGRTAPRSGADGG